MPVNDPDQSPDNPALTFIPYLAPPLPSGQYEVTASQVVEVAGTQDSFKSSQQFLVQGERYRLAPATLNSLSPRSGARGEFSEQLPHVVLNAATLPWQRSPCAEPSKDGAAPPSWLAVLLFDESDPPPVPRQLALGQLVSAEGAFFPPRAKEPGEDLASEVTVVELDIDLFDAIAPSLDDLRWNAHVRRVDPQAKASLDGSLPQTDHALVVGNRLPASGHSSVAHLVSLEHFADYLPDDTGQRSAALPPDARRIRLVSLTSWSFSCRDGQHGFGEVFEALDRQPAALQMPWNQAAAEDGDGQVATAFGLGYSAMNHALRNGQQTVSWYRGPFLPVTGNALAPAQTLRSHPDQLLRYDPVSGMFDVSHSAAWQLGRLLALQNGSFASTLYRWKLGHTQAQLQAWNINELDEMLAPLKPSATPKMATDSRVERVLNDLLGPAVDALAATIDQGKN